MSVITVERKLLEKNDFIAGELRKEFLERNIFAVNIISSPGSGKTSLIENIIPSLNYKLKVSVITGDLQTDNDAQRIGALGVPVVQIITNGACHLDANLVRDAWNSLNKDVNLLIIENVGNLVCPSGFDLGEAAKIVIHSTTEGDDKPLKYPQVFRNSSVLVINKIDLLPYLNSSVDIIMENALSVNPHLDIFQTSCVSGKGIDELTSWLQQNCLK
jgi:hydrogenase nickel incorporation protein HypB